MLGQCFPRDTFDLSPLTHEADDISLRQLVGEAAEVDPGGVLVLVVPGCRRAPEDAVLQLELGDPLDLSDHVHGGGSQKRRGGHSTTQIMITEDLLDVGFRGGK